MTSNTVTNPAPGLGQSCHFPAHASRPVGGRVRVSVPAEVIDALSRLNVHARACGGWGSNVRDAIYSYKTLAAAVLIRSGEGSVRLVRWTGKCNRCTDGWFTHWDWQDGHKVRCRDCSGTGQRTLRFTETTLPNGATWHHPWFTGRVAHGDALARMAIEGLHFAHDGVYRTPDGAEVEWHAAGDWSPNMPAERLVLAELVPLLNLVEVWVETAPAVGWIAECAKRHLHQVTYRRIIGEPSHSYQLDLGKHDGGCFVCGERNSLAGHSYGRMTPLFHWSLPVCTRHGEGPEKAAHPKDPPPAEMLTPDIRAWMARHEIVKELH